MQAPRKTAIFAVAATAVMAGSALLTGAAVAQSPAAVDLGSATGEVTALMIGWPDQDGTDPITGKPTIGIGHLEAAFEAKHPEIDLKIVNIPYGAGSADYGPKTESMVQANEACVYEMPASYDYAQRGLLQDLDVLIAADPTFEDVWEGSFLENSKAWTPDNPSATISLPGYTGLRVILYDAKLFEDWGVEPLSANPTVDEITTKAKALTGKNPKTGEDNYGYWYQGKYISWQFQTLAHALGANWGHVNDDGTWSINWNTPEYLAGLTKLIELAQYAPQGALATEGPPPGFLTEDNVVAMYPDAAAGEFVSQLIDLPTEIQQRYRVVHNLRGPDGLGGLATVTAFTMAAGCPNKLAAWEVLKFLTGDPEAQSYYFAVGDLPTIEGGSELTTSLKVLPDEEIIVTEPGHTEPRYPWAASGPRWALQAALQAALAGTLSPEEALAQAQRETDYWLSQQK